MIIQSLAVGWQPTRNEAFGESLIIFALTGSITWICEEHSRCKRKDTMKGGLREFEAVEGDGCSFASTLVENVWEC